MLHAALGALIGLEIFGLAQLFRGRGDDRGRCPLFLAVWGASASAALDTSRPEDLSSRRPAAPGLRAAPSRG